MRCMMVFKMDECYVRCLDGWEMYGCYVRCMDGLGDV